MKSAKLDWPGLMNVGLHQLGLSVEEFWNLTPHELEVKLGVSGAKASVLTRSGFTTLMAEFPDMKESAKNGRSQ
tara:strand:- start:26250 stop:26471 length:222 start_codon:yes stop_codon:yes gene_type:complete